MSVWLDRDGVLRDVSGFHPIDQMTNLCPECVSSCSCDDAYSGERCYDNCAMCGEDCPCRIRQAPPRLTTRTYAMYASEVGVPLPQNPGEQK